MNRILFYGMIFTGVVGITGTAAYFLAPSRVVNVDNSTEQAANETTDSSDDDTFIPKPMTPIDYFTDNLTSMKSLVGEAELTLKKGDYEISLTDVDVDLTLETLTSPNVKVDALLGYNGETTPISVSYVESELYVSLLGNDLKIATDDFSTLGDILSSFNIPLEMPDLFGDMTLESLTNMIGGMTYADTTSGYTFTLNFTEDCPIYFYTDADYFLIGLSIPKFAFDDISLSLNADVVTSKEIENEIISPESETRVFTPFSDFFPALEGVADLIKTKQFGVAIEGTFKKSGETLGTDFAASTDFDLSSKVGGGELVITQNELEFTPVHTVKIDVDNEDMHFQYNENMFGKFNLTTIKDVVSMFGELIDSKDARFYEWFGGFINGVKTTTISQLKNGHFEILFQDLIKTLEVKDGNLHVVIDKAFFDVDSDLDITIVMADNKLSSVTIAPFSAFGMTINLSVSLTAYNAEREKLPSEEEQTYYDFSDIKVLLALGITTANLNYFHITGNIDLPINVIGIDFNNLIKDVKLDLSVFDEDGKIKVIGTLDPIPTKGPINGIGIADYKAKRLELYYEDGFIYMCKYDWTLGFFTYNSVVTSIRVAQDVFMDNILDYLLHFGLGLRDSIMNKINESITESAARTSAPDYSTLIKGFSYEVQADGTDHWFMNLDISNIANNPDLNYLKVDIYGKDVTIGDVTEKYLTSVYVDLYVYTGSAFSLNVLLTANLVDIDPSITKSDFASMSSYQNYTSYIAAHQSDVATY